jgi:ABC-type glycerol-3-phosphate transport system substrate-binding protein/methyl-accepting chemotaxis protein
MVFERKKSIVSICIGICVLAGIFTSKGEVLAKEADSIYVNEMISHNYTMVKKEYQSKVYQGDVLKYKIEDTIIEKDMLTVDNYEYSNAVASMGISDTITMQLDIAETAQYQIRFDYYSIDESILPIELSFQVNGDFPFYETRRLTFETTWVTKQDVSIDRYGNEIVSIPDKLKRWESKYLMDASYRYSDPLLVELEKGINEITISVAEGNLLLGNLYLEPVKELPQDSMYESADGSNLIVIQGEDFTYRNDSSIRAVAEFETALDPYEISKTLLNTIDSDSFKTAGQKVSYEFEVEESGYYYVATNYRQSEKSDFPVFVDVAIDDFIMDSKLKSYPLEYTTKYKTHTLSYGEDKISVYLEQGKHEISMTISNENVREVLEAIDKIMNGVNDLSLEVTKVAGTNKDKYRDLNIVKYIPDVEERLLQYAKELDDLRESMLIYNQEVSSIAAFSSMSVASEQLKSLAEEPNELTYRVAELSTSMNSVNKNLANAIDTINKNNVSIDRIYLYQDQSELPKQPGIFKSLGLTVQRFFSSFVNQAYSTSNVDEQHLQVWVNRSRQHLEIMQKMIDEGFTKETGIQVDLSIMPDQNKLVLANASGDEPDIATGINYAIPFELGIRGATVDLTKFDDFTEIANRYQAGLHIPATIDDGIYSLPETMNFWILFYRTDILQKLGLTVPDTMDDVVDMLPELQMRGLNFFYPTAQMLVMRNFHGTTPLIFQNGGSLYSEYAGDTALNSDASVKALTDLTELFTIYNMPIDVPNFYQHFRNGYLPIGIADYATYNLLVNAAPEIANSWEVSLVPGTLQEDGSINRTTSGGAESTVMFTSEEDETITLTDGSTMNREDASWEFMKWWSSSEVQTEYGQTLQISYGEEYIWATANLEAFMELPWDTKDKAIIAEQSTYVVEAPRILGTYMLERELSNCFNDVVVNGKILRSRIDEAVKVIDRETERKLEEFGYIDSEGTVLKEYRVPTLEHVKEILGKK